MTTSNRLVLAPALAGLLTLGAITAAQAQAPTGSTADPSAASSPHQRAAMSGDSDAHKMGADRDGTDPAKFVNKAAQGGLTEVALSKAAASKSQDPTIRQFANRMVQDHGKANDELSGIAKNKGLPVPDALDAEHQAIVQKMSNKSGADFDRAYSKQMELDHAKTVALFEGATRSSDSDLAAFAKKTLPTLQEHKQMADKLPGAPHSAAGADPASKM